VKAPASISWNQNWARGQQPGEGTDEDGGAQAIVSLVVRDRDETIGSAR
jgi:hypothetical protein